MEHALPHSLKLYGEEKLHSRIAFAFESSKNGALERLCADALDNLKKTAPTVFEECHKLPATDGYILVMTPCKKYMRFINQSSDQDLIRMERYYRNHSCDICQKKETEEDFPKISRCGRYDSKLLDDICEHPGVKGTHIDVWDISVDIDAGWFWITLGLTEYVGDEFERSTWKEYRPGVFYRDTPGLFGNRMFLYITVSGIITSRYIKDSAEEDFIEIVAAHMEIVELLEKMKYVDELLPQPIAEEINIFYH